MRPPAKAAPKKPARKPLLSADTAKELLKLRRWAGEALAEVRVARAKMASMYAGPEHAALARAEACLENVMRGEAKR